MLDIATDNAMQEMIPTILTATTQQELDQAVRQYIASDLKGMELFQRWQAIRNAALQLGELEGECDRIPGDDSY